MTAFIAPFFGAGYQSFTNQGVVNAGGSITTYLANSTTLAATWTDSTQAVQNGNPLALDSAGRPPQQIWLQSGQAYKCIVKDSTGVQLGPEYNNLAGINDTSAAVGTQWVASGLTPTYLSASTFSVAGNQTTTLQVGRRVQLTVTAGTRYGSISASVFSGGGTTVTVTLDSGVLDSGLSTLNYGLLSATNDALPTPPRTYGTYAPTITAQTNISLITPYAAFTWARVGNMVSVFGAVAVTPTGPDREFFFTATLPVATTIGSTFGRLCGSMVSADPTALDFQLIGGIYGNAATNVANCTMWVRGVADFRTYLLNFSYIVV